MNVETPIHSFLAGYRNRNVTRCHTPGHKGRGSPEAARDITEIHGAGSLFDENDSIITKSESIAARLFGAEKTLYSCAGSTLAIQTMLTLVKHSGAKKIATFRYAHRSFVSAAALLDLDVDWFYSVSDINTAGVSAVFMNNLDYYGRTYDISKAAALCKKAGIPLLVDNAHGAYLVLTGRHPLALGAAMSADSAHKTLPALTGAAYLHINDERFAQGAKSAMSLLGSTSPSYLILESLDLCNAHIAALKSEKHTAAFGYVRELKDGLRALGFFLRESDALRVTVDARRCGYTGLELADKLRETGIECEYADETYTVLLFSTTTDEQDATAVTAAFGEIEVKNSMTAAKDLTFPVTRPKYNMSIREALLAPESLCAYLPPSAATGRTCAEIIAPSAFGMAGVPVIMPGELIGAQEAQLLRYCNVNRIKCL